MGFDLYLKLCMQYVGNHDFSEAEEELVIELAEVAQ